MKVGAKLTRDDGKEFEVTFASHWSRVISSELPHEEDSIKWYGDREGDELYVSRDLGHTYVRKNR